MLNPTYRVSSVQARVKLYKIRRPMYAVDKVVWST
jgi:hypothetical protein